MINTIHTVIDEVLRRRGLDWRTCFTDVYARPPGGSIVVEFSDGDVEQEVRDELLGRALDVGAAEFITLPARDETLPELCVSASSVSDVRREAAHSSELVTQVILGDVVVPLKTSGEWFLVRLADGYVGWIRDWHLTGTTRSAVDAFAARARHRVKSNTVQIYTEASEDSPPLSDAVAGTRLAMAACDKRGWRSVELPDGRTGFSKARGLETLPRTRRPSRDKLAATGLRFLGIPYLWGGCTPKGFDCSGLVQRIFQLHGVLMPRDSDQQSLRGKEKPVGSTNPLKTGDLLFFGKSPHHITHVAMYLSDGLFLHAYGQVRVGSLDPKHPLFESKLVGDWQITRDPLAESPPRRNE